MSQRVLTALPVFNEVRYIAGVLDEVRRYSPDVLVVDDGSSDGTTEWLAAQLAAEKSHAESAIGRLHVVTHPRNRGYGAALASAFDFARCGGYDVLVTIDCDGQHQPKRIPEFVEACEGWDIVSGSRYLEHYEGDDAPPAERRRINELLTEELNRRLGLRLTDAFCGFKAYTALALERLRPTEPGYAMPLEVWVQAVAAGLRIRELPVPLIYLDLSRSFGGSLDDADRRLAHYRDVLERSMADAKVAESRSPTACGGCAG